MKKFKQFLLEDEIDEFSFFNSILNDEITAAVLYLKIANKLFGQEYNAFREQMKEHSNDEYRHFTDLLEAFSNKFPQYSFYFNFTKDLNPLIDYNVIEFTQKLELEAKMKYEKLIEYAIDKQDNVLEDLFRKILAEEEEHFFDVKKLQSEEPLTNV